MPPSWSSTPWPRTLSCWHAWPALAHCCSEQLAMYPGSFPVKQSERYVLCRSYTQVSIAFNANGCHLKDTQSGGDGPDVDPISQKQHQCMRFVLMHSMSCACLLLSCASLFIFATRVAWKTTPGVFIGFVSAIGSMVTMFFLVALYHHLSR